MAEKFPSVARFFYFHIDNREELKGAWKELALRMGITVGDEDLGMPHTEKYQKHGLTKVRSIEGDTGSLSIFLYKNVAIIALVLSIPGGVSEVLGKVRFSDLPGGHAAIGGAAILISKADRSKGLEKELGKRFTKIDTGAGILCQFEEKEGLREHIYALAAKPGLKGLEHFLNFHFPIFDFTIHKLHMERDYFLNQRKWVLNEKAEIDKTVGDILHKRIVGETLNPDNIAVFEREIDTLSTKYGILVNDGHLIRKSRMGIEEDIEEVYRALREIGRLPSEEGLDIIKRSEELKKRLLEDEASLGFAIKNVKTAIDTVRTNVDLLRSRENISLQEEAVSFQVAAGVLEFIIIFYYSVASWEHILGTRRIEVISPPTRFISIFLFALLSVVLTHFVGKSFREKWRINKGMIVSGAGLVLVFIYIVWISIATKGLLHTA